MPTVFIGFVFWPLEQPVFFFEIRVPEEGRQNGKLKPKNIAWLCQVLSYMNKNRGLA
jgi:hypothetical protein